MAGGGGGAVQRTVAGSKPRIPRVVLSQIVTTGVGTTAIEPLG